MKTVKGTLMICDGRPDLQNQIHNIDLIDIPKERVPVNLNFDKCRLAGMAKLDKKDNKVIAAIELSDNFNPMYYNLVPCVGALYQNGKMFINEIGLCYDNADNRIDRLDKFTLDPISDVEQYYKLDYDDCVIDIYGKALSHEEIVLKLNNQVSTIKSLRQSLLLNEASKPTH